jgi:hypothetical protein
MNKQKILAALATIGLAAGALVGIAAPAMADKPETGHTPVGVCHATPADTAAQGWNAITVDDDSVVTSAHNEEHSADIIADSASLPGGKNLSTVFFGHTGAEIIANGCVLPADPEPLVATAEVSFVPATCDAPEQLVLGATSNASFGTDTDASALGYNVVATADVGSEFADGDPATKSFVGTLDDVLDPSDPACYSAEPLVATAEVSFVPATCDAPEQLVLGATSNASFGGDTDASALGFDVVATADAGAEFADGDPATKSFVGTLDDVLDPSDPACAEEEHEKITLCHATPADTAAQGWTEIEVDDSAVVTSAHFEEHSADIIPISPGVPDGKNLDTLFSGFTGQQIIDNDCVLPEAGVATAVVSFVPATCLAAEQLVLGAISNATFGADTDASALGYSVVATADAGSVFADGDEGDNTKKTFAGTLDGPLPSDDPACDLTTLDLVMPQVTSVQPTCTASGSYTLGAAAGYNPAYVKWTVDGVTDVASGTYPVTTSRIVTIVAVPVAPHGFEFGWVQPAPIAFTVPSASACDDLPTLAFTGSTSDSDAGLLIAGGLLFLGVAGVYARRRLVTRSE